MLIVIAQINLIAKLLKNNLFRCVLIKKKKHKLNLFEFFFFFLIFKKYKKKKWKNWNWIKKKEKKSFLD